MSKRSDKILSFLKNNRKEALQRLLKEAARRGKVTVYGEGGEDIPSEMLLDVLKQQEEKKDRRKSIFGPSETVELHEEPALEAQPLEEPDLDEEPELSEELELEADPLEATTNTAAERAFERYNFDFTDIIREKYNAHGPENTPISNEQIEDILSKMLLENIDNLSKAKSKVSLRALHVAITDRRREARQPLLEDKKRRKEELDEMFEALKIKIVEHHKKMKKEFIMLVAPEVDPESGKWISTPLMSRRGTSYGEYLHVVWLHYLEGIVPNSSRAREVYPNADLYQHALRGKKLLAGAGASKHLQEYLSTRKGVRTHDFLGARLFAALKTLDI